MTKPSIAGPSESGAHCTRIGVAAPLRLDGRVSSGRGLGTLDVQRNADKIREALGESVVAGSLNIVLKRPIKLMDETAIQMHFDKMAWPGRLNGMAVWLHRWQSAPLHIVEVLSAVHLRSHLNLADGDEVHIEARKCDVARVSNVGWLTWHLFWLGRTGWTYRDDYYFRAKRWCLEFGATQQGTKKNCRDLTRALTKSAVKKFLTT